MIRASSYFASDNNAGICPPALAALIAADRAGHEPAYGEDRWTGEVCERMRALFETDCEVFFVFNGTAANALSLASLCQSYHAVICHKIAHVETDECGAPEFFSNGSKLLVAEGANGKLDVAAIERIVASRTDLHFPKPKALTLTQSTEAGTVYTLAEIAAITAAARKLGLKVHMDGARFANAVARSGVAPAAMTWAAGVDVLSFGGTKNGLPAGEAVVFFNKALAEDFAWRAKQAGQLASKMRYISAPWLGLLEGGVWLDNARHANAMATRLADAIAGADGVEIIYPVEANAVFVGLSPSVQAALRDDGYRFYNFIGDRGCRLMCAWDTTAEAVDRFAAAIIKRAGKGRKARRA